MMHQQQVMPPQPTNQTEMYDHNQMSQQLREERRKEYNDYLVSDKPPVATCMSITRVCSELRYYQDHILHLCFVLIYEFR